MTASSKADEAKPDRKPLPRLLVVVVEAFRLVTTKPFEYYGIVGWLLVPLLLSIAAYATQGSVGSFLLSIAQVGYFMLLMWSIAACMLMSAAHFVHDDRAVDPRHLPTLAWERTFPLVITLVAAAILELAGLLLIIPGIIIAVYLAFAGHEAVLGNHTFLRGLAGSRDLVRGRFMQVFSRTFGLAALYVVIYVGLATGVAAIATALGVLSPDELINGIPPVWFQTTVSLIEIILLPFAVAAHTLLYLAAKAR